MSGQMDITTGLLYKGDQKWLDYSLSAYSDFCNNFIILNTSNKNSTITARTANSWRQKGLNVSLVSTAGVNKEPKAYLYKMVKKERTKWMLFLNEGEILGEEAKDQMPVLLDDNSAQGFRFFVRTLWDSKKEFRCDKG
ncbi:MAG: hypothetical protein NTZ10_03495 [Candidatus Saganbacteria bacterium]|nr:hypothetical protein [Candidatus Saganbacteria bacterium]